MAPISLEKISAGPKSVSNDLGRLEARRQRMLGFA
jgi:hypothetical protein